ncbi:MAG: molecular chaperone [Rhodospirillales bacterium]|jgi:molecular chaperone Hsp33|nr:molecular chaperone [Rhodospirillales bacterium]
MAKETPFKDLIQPFKIEDLGLRGRLVRLGPTAEAILGPHNYPRAVAEMMGETLTLTAMLASALKFDGVFKFQAQGDGPLSLMVADMGNDGALRGYARFDDAAIAALGDSRDAPVPRLIGQGRMAVTVDHGPNSQQIQGITEMAGPTLAACAQTYFRQSEPLETVISLASTSTRAAGLMIQRLPPEEGAGRLEGRDLEDEWRRATALSASVTADELLDSAILPGELLYRLFHEDGVRLFKTRPVRHSCRCSKGKVKATLAAFSRDDINSMAEDGRIAVTCEFCKSEYVFEGQSLTDLHPA